MTYRVLIVDDSLTVRMDLRDAFEADGFGTILCATGAEARQAFVERRLRRGSAGRAAARRRRPRAAHRAARECRTGRT